MVRPCQLPGTGKFVFARCSAMIRHLALTVDDRSPERRQPSSSGGTQTDYPRNSCTPTAAPRLPKKTRGSTRTNQAPVYPFQVAHTSISNPLMRSVFPPSSTPITKREHRVQSASFSSRGLAPSLRYPHPCPACVLPGLRHLVLPRVGGATTSLRRWPLGRPGRPS